MIITSNKRMKIFFGLLLALTAPALFAQKHDKFTVNFDFNKNDITPATAARLDSFIIALQSKPASYTIELFGHCDSVGTNEYNDALSQRRVMAVKNYLTGKGFQQAVIVMEQALGKREPLNDNATEYERFLNRRVEVALNSHEAPMVIREEKPVEKTITAIVEDTATKIGSKITLRDLNFLGGRHFLLPQSMPVIQELVDLMKKNPPLEISIEGHVCCLPDKSDGMDFDMGTYNLSEMRAKMVYEQLIRNGIAARRLSYQGFGHRFPIIPYPETTDEERITNRRVEIKIVNK